MTAYLELQPTPAWKEAAVSGKAQRFPWREFLNIPLRQFAYQRAGEGWSQEQTSAEVCSRLWSTGAEVTQYLHNCIKIGVSAAYSEYRSLKGENMEEKIEDIKQEKETERKVAEEFVEISEEEARKAEEMSGKYAKFSSGVDYYLVFDGTAPLGKIMQPKYDSPDEMEEVIVRRVSVIARGTSLDSLTECSQIWDIRQKVLKEAIQDYVDAGTLGQWIWKYKKTGSGLETKHKLIVLKQRGS